MRTHSLASVLLLLLVLSPAGGALAAGRDRGGTEYVLRSSGTSYVLTRPDGASESGLDAGALLQHAIDALTGHGGTVRLRAGDTFVWSDTVPRFGPGNTNWLTVTGYGARIVLSEAAPQAFGFRKNADFDHIDFVRIEGVQIDGANVPGRNSVIGNFVAGRAVPRRVGWRHLHLRDLDIHGVRGDPEATSNHQGFIRLQLDLDPADTATVEARDILIERVRLHGGNWGVLIAANKNNPQRTVIDGVVIRDGIHDMRPRGREIQPARFPSTGFQVGGYASVGDVTFRDLTVYAPGDNCFEINNARTALLEGGRCFNALAVGTTLYEYMDRPVPVAQRLTIRDYYQETSDSFADDGGGPCAISVSGVNGSMGSILLDNVMHKVRGAVSWSRPPALAMATGKRGIRDLSIVNSRMEWDGFSRSGSQGAWWSAVLADIPRDDFDGDGSADIPSVTISNLRLAGRLEEREGTLTLRFVGLLGSGRYDVSNVDIDVVTNTDDEVTGVLVGGTESQFQDGAIRGLRIAGRFDNAAVRRTVHFYPPGQGQANLGDAFRVEGVSAPEAFARDPRDWIKHRVRMGP